MCLCSGPRSIQVTDVLALTDGRRLLHPKTYTPPNVHGNGEPDKITILYTGPSTCFHAFLGDGMGGGSSGASMTRPPRCIGRGTLQLAKRGKTAFICSSL